MTREEAKKLVMIITAYYPNWHPADLTFTVNAWYAALKEYNYKNAELALLTYTKTETKGFAPSPGQVIEKMFIADQYTEPNEMEAWTLVSKALRNSIYGAEEEFEKLPRIVQKAVVSPSNLRNWAMADSESVETVIQSNFLRTYRTTKSRDAELKRLPDEVQSLIGQTLYQMQVEQKSLRCFDNRQRYGGIDKKHE